jgi:hypothetical protein
MQIEYFDHTGRNGLIKPIAESGGARAALMQYTAGRFDAMQNLQGACSSPLAGVS